MVAITMVELLPFYAIQRLLLERNTQTITLPWRSIV